MPRSSNSNNTFISSSHLFLPKSNNHKNTITDAFVYFDLFLIALLRGTATATSDVPTHLKIPDQTLTEFCNGHKIHFITGKNNEKEKIETN